MMSTSSLLLLHELMENESFVKVMEEFSDEQAVHRVEALRSATRAAAFSEASRMEGQIEVFEELVSMLKETARRYRP